MDLDLVNKISGLAVHGYYEPSKGTVVVHFFNNQDGKNDIIAYLKRNMSWDVREITNENATLYPDREIVEIHHAPIGIHVKGSKFDQFVRAALYQTIPGGTETPARDLNKMFEVLEDGFQDN
jgi:hypothetical protein